MMLKFLLMLVEAGTSFFEIILMLSFLDGFLEKKELPFLRKYLAILGGFVLVFAGSYLLSDYSFAVMLNYLVVTIIISFILYKGKFVHRVFSCILLLALLLVVELITVVVLIWGMNLDSAIIQSTPILKFVGVVIKNVISLAMIRIICNIRKSDVREGGKLYIISLLTVPMISIVVSIIIFELALTYKVEDISMVLLALLGLMYINAIVFGIFESITRHFDNEYKYKMVEKQLELQVNHYNKLAENRELLFETIHDFKNHLNCIYNLYKYNKGNELGNYIENLISVSGTGKIIDTGNPIIDALLNDKADIAHKLGINFKSAFNLPSNINIAHNDICAVLGNSMDNAIEACRRIENKSLVKEIELSMNYRDSYLIIVVTNTFDQPPLKEGRFFRSSKISPGLHGFGMQSIERTVKKYNGNMVVKYDKSLFALEIVMSTA